MALNITRRDIDEAHRYARDAMARVRGQSASQRGSLSERLTRTGGVLVGALGVGVMSGRFGPLNFQGVPVPLDLAAGFAGHLLGFMGLGGSFTNHLHNISDGILAGYATKAGVGLGKTWAQKSGLPPRTVVGAEPRRLAPSVFTGAEPLSEAELAAMAQAVR